MFPDHLNTKVLAAWNKNRKSAETDGTSILVTMEKSINNVPADASPKGIACVSKLTISLSQPWEKGPKTELEMSLRTGILNITNDENLFKAWRESIAVGTEKLKEQEADGAYEILEMSCLVLAAYGGEDITQAKFRETLGIEIENLTPGIKKK